MNMNGTLENFRARKQYSVHNGVRGEYCKLFYLTEEASYRPARMYKYGETLFYTSLIALLLLISTVKEVHSKTTDREHEDLLTSVPFPHSRR